MLFPTNANQVQAFAGALYGVQVGSVTMAQVTSDITSGGGLNAVLNRYYSASFGSMTTTAVATTFATNLGLTGESLTEGIAYTVARLNAVTADARGAEISDILNLFTTLTADATFGTAATAWTTKVTTAAAYTGTANVAIGTVVAESAGVFALTANADVVTGTSGNDTFSGTAGTIDGDVLDGGAGTDTLNLTVTITDDDGSAFQATDIEIISLRSTGGTANDAALIDLEFGDVSGLETLEFRRINDDIQIANLQSLDTTIKMSNNATAADVVIGFEASVVAGTADTANVTIDSTTGGADLTINGVETIAVTVVDEDNDLNVDGDDLETVTVTGAGDLNMDVDASVTTFDASSSTGGIQVNLTAAADVTVTGGAGDDTIAFAAGIYNDDDVVDGGEGTDTLNITAFATTAGETYSSDNIEILRLESAAVTVQVDQFSGYEGFTTVRVDAGAHALVLSDVDNDSTVLLTNNTAGTDATQTSLTLTLASDTGTADIANVTLTANGDDTGVDLTVGTLSVDEIETVNLTLNATSDGSIAVGEMTSNEIEILNVLGAADAELGSVTALTIETIDASAATGDIEFNLGAVDSNVTGGAGDDTFTFVANLDSDDTVDGGDGDDTLTATLTAGTTAASISNVEAAALTFGNAGATFSGVNADENLTEITIAAASTQAISLTRLSESVATVNVSITGANDVTVGVGFAANSDSAHEVVFGQAAADVDVGAVTITGNTGALTVTSNGTATNAVASIAANAATSLNIVSEVAFINEGALNATAALTASLTTDGGAMTITGVQNLTNATALVFAAADGNMTLTGAMTATDAESLTVTATDDFLQTGDFVSDADIAVSLTADGSSASIRYDGILDVDHATDIALTAIDGGSVVIDDIELLGVNSDLENITSSITITSTGEDDAGVESVVTVSAINTATATLDLISIVSDADGEVNLTTGAANLTITEIDASESLGTLVLNTSTIAAAISVTLGAGTNTVTTALDLADEIILADGAGTDTIIVLDDTTAADVVTNFEAGAGGDVISIDVSTLGTGAESFNSVALSSALVINIGTDDDGVLADADDAVTANTNILRLTDTFANIAAVVAAIDLSAEANADGLLDNDVLLVLWTDGANSYLSTVTLDADDGAGADAGADLVELVGVSVSDLTAANFAFV